jgi:hypothetical protein
MTNVWKVKVKFEKKNYEKVFRIGKCQQVCKKFK